MTVARSRRVIPGARVTTDARLAPITRRRCCRVQGSVALFFLLSLFPGFAAAEEAARPVSSQPEESRLRDIVEKLASPEFAGRSGAGGAKTADFLVEQFRSMGLEPAFEGDFVQEIPSNEKGKPQGRNIGGWLRGTDPRLKDEWIVVGTHYDHLGVQNGTLFPGADDNASGVAMMLETARSIVAKPVRPLRSVLFLGFDLEELGLFGSRYYVAHPAVPLDRITLFVTADMISRALAGVCEKDLFVFGTEHAPEMRPWITEAAVGKPLNVGILGADILVLNRSDYGPFRSRNVPFLFFSTGENPRYHSPRDDAASLDYPKFTAVSRLIHQVVERAASTEETPKWRTEPDHPLQEAIALRDVMRQLLKNQDKLRIRTAQLYLMNNTLKSLDAIIARGLFTPEDRAGVIQVARIILFTVL